MRERSKYRIPNFGRILFSISGLYMIRFYNIKNAYINILTISHLTFSVVWILLIELGIYEEEKYNWSAYIPAGFDMFALAIWQIITGNIHSNINLINLVIVGVSSVSPSRLYGIYSSFLVCISFIIIGFMVHYNILPNINLLSTSVTEVTFPTLLSASFWMIGSVIIVNNIVYKFVSSNVTLAKKAEKERFITENLLKNLQADLKIANRIQATILPSAPAFSKNAKFATKYIPMGEVGGDLYDFMDQGVDRFRIMVADATGHGVQAALLTMAIKSEYENFKTFMERPEELLSVLNSQFYIKYKFLNAFFSCIVVDIDLYNCTISYASAGHPNQIVYDGVNKIELQRTGKLIGMINNTKYETKTLTFNPGSRLFLFTDGIFEQFNRTMEEFSQEKVESLFIRYHHLPLADTLNEVINELREFLGESDIQDDITLVAIEHQIDKEISKEPITSIGF